VTVTHLRTRGKRFLVSILLAAVVPLSALASISVAPPAASAATYYSSGTIYWGPTNDGCAGNTSCEWLLTVQAWPTGGSLGLPTVLGLMSKDVCDLEWDQGGDESLSSGGNYYAETFVNILDDSCGSSNGNWRIVWSVT
jgi:hypothetical protein